MAGDASRSLPTPFLTKTYQLVDDREIDEIISWNEDGSTFVVWNPTEFARDLLPKYFKHNNFSSFVRQLNTYGFRKVVPDRWEFSNECFRRGEKKLLCDIQRRKVCPQISSPSPCTATAGGAPPPSAVTTPPPPPPPFPRTLSPSDSGDEQVISTSNSAREFTGTTAELIGENERLRKENVQLNKELTQMKSLCNNIYALMSNYKSSDDGTDRHRQAGGQTCKLRPLDLLPMTSFCQEMKLGSPDPNGVDENNSIKCAAEEISARLFGVPIGGVKRWRENDGTGYSSSEDAMMTTMDLQLQQPGGDAVKSEPLDVDEEMDGVYRQMVEESEGV